MNAYLKMIPLNHPFEVHFKTAILQTDAEDVPIYMLIMFSRTDGFLLEPETRSTPMTNSISIGESFFGKKIDQFIILINNLDHQKIVSSSFNILEKYNCLKSLHHYCCYF